MVDSFRLSAPKKSTWVRRKTEELNECFEQGESDPQKIDECDNFADPQTKYLVGKVWLPHNCWFVGFRLLQVPSVTFRWSAGHGGCLRDRCSHPEGGCA